MNDVSLNYITTDQSENKPSYDGPNYYKKFNSNNLTVPQAISSLNINQTILTSSTSTSTIPQLSDSPNTNSRAKQQRKSESDITQNLISQKQQNVNASPVHYPPSIPNNNTYNSSPSKNHQITVKATKSNI